MPGVTLEHEWRKNGLEEADFQGHENVYFAEPQKAIIAGNWIWIALKELVWQRT